MANPQRENGFTAVANEILENVYARKFSANQLSVVLVVWRYTYGFQRKTHEFSLSFLIEATGIDKKAVKRSLDSLIENQVVKVVKEAGFTSSRVLEFNKNYEEWAIEHRGGKNDHSPVGKVTPSPVGKNDHQERKIKESIKKEEEETNPVKLFETNFGILTPYQMTGLWKWVDDFNSQEVVCLAVKETAISNPRTPFKYLDRVLADWHRRKLLTVEDVLREKKKHEEQQQKIVPIKKSNTDVDWEAL